MSQEQCPSCGAKFAVNRGTHMCPNKKYPVDIVLTDAPSPTAVNFVHVSGGVCFAHGRFTGPGCPEWPKCATDPQKDEYKAMVSKPAVAVEEASKPAQLDLVHDAFSEWWLGNSRSINWIDGKPSDRDLWDIWGAFHAGHVFAASQTAQLQAERDAALANADFWERELNNFRRNAAHRAEQLAEEKVASLSAEIERLKGALTKFFGKHSSKTEWSADKRKLKELLKGGSE